VTAALVVTDKDQSKRAFLVEFGARHAGPMARKEDRLVAEVALWAGKMDGSQSILKPLHRVVKGKGGVETWEAVLKVERRGGELRGLISGDGKEWWPRPGGARKSGHPNIPDDRIDGDVKVGVAAISHSGEKFTVTFDQFRLTPVKAKGK